MVASSHGQETTSHTYTAEGGRLSYAGMVVLKTALLLCLFTFSACALRPKSVSSELANLGPVSVSAENPYVAPNMLLAKLMGSSNVVSGFIETRGVPDAIEVVDGLFSSPAVYLYYPNEGEQYQMQLSGEEWLIHSGKAIPLPVLQRLTGSTGQSPQTVTVLADREQKKKLSSKSSQAKSVAASRYDSKDRVDETSSGDILHTVAIPGENLSAISRWYTGDVENAGRIARINGIADPNKLQLKQKVRIPRYLLIRSTPFTKAELNQIQ